VSKLTIEFGFAKNVAQKITTKKSQVLQNDYKHSGYDDKINLAISLTISRSCTELNPLHKIKGKA
jgi:hypothetical protein